MATPKNIKNVNKLDLSLGEPICALLAYFHSCYGSLLVKFHC